MFTATQRVQHSLIAATLAFGTAVALLAAVPAASHRYARVRAAEPTATPLPPCTITAARNVAPLTARVGESVDVTVSLVARCPIERYPLHIVYVIDGSRDMATAEGREVLKSVRRSIAALTPDDRTDLRVGVVGYNARPTVSCQLSRDRNAALRCIDRIRPRGEARLDVGLDRALGLLTYARALGGGDRDSVREWIVVVARQPRGGPQCGRALSAKGRVWGQGILLVTACVGLGCDEACVRSLATSPRYFLDWRSPLAIEQLIDEMFRSLTHWHYQALRVRDIALTDTLPSSVTLITNSAQPEPNATGQTPTTLTWQPSHMPKEGVTMTYRVRVDTVGAWTVPAQSTGWSIDSRNRRGAFEVPVGRVEVVP